MKGAIGYIRVSSDDQLENNSFDDQTRAITGYCKQNDIPLLRIVDFSESAWTDERESFDQVEGYCREHRSTISAVIVMNLSRLARNVQVQAQFIVRLRLLGITLISVTEPMADDSAMGQFMRNIIGSVNQLFSDSLSEQTRHRMQTGVKAGRFLWKAPIGYVNMNKGIQVDPVRGPLVREAFELIASGRFVTTDRVLKFVTSMGLTTAKGAPVSKQTFARMLQNPIYAGWIKSGDVCVRGNHENLVSDALFNTVQEKINSKSVPHKQLNEDFPLRGIVLCNECEKPLTAGWAKGRSQKYARYWCYNAKCKAVGISCDDLHRQFTGLLSLLAPTAELLAQLPERIAERLSVRRERIAADARRLNGRLAEIRTLNQRAIAAMLKNEISADDYDSFKKANAEEVSRIEAELTALDSERGTMEEMLKQAMAQAVDLVGAWGRQRPSTAGACEGVFPRWACVQP